MARIPENLDTYPFSYIVQAYTMIAEDGSEERVRRERECTGEVKYKKGRKVGVGISRVEGSEPITKLEFETESNNALGMLLEKVRYKIPHNGRKIEFNIFANPRDLMLIEVEFDTDEQAKEFVPLDWFGQEVTDDPRYNGQQIALHGIPK